MVGASRPVSGSASGNETAVKTPWWLPPLVVCLFFLWGFATVLIDTLIPKLKSLFTLSYAEAMLTQFSFFIAYFIMSIPAGQILSRIGYLPSVVMGLLVMAAGCLLFAPAAMLGLYPGFLLALFVMASGITLLQVAANPLMANLGGTARSHSRLTLAQAFNSLGTTIGPIVGATFMLAGGVAAIDAANLTPDALAAIRRAEAYDLQLPFLGIAAGLVVLAVIFFRVRGIGGLPMVAPATLSLALLKKPRLALGAVSIFAYVGAEVTIGSFLVSYLMRPDTLAAPAETAGRLISLYWGGAMIGRFIGSAVLRRVPAGWALFACAIGASCLAALSASSTGLIAGIAIIAVGLCNSIMFPTIFTVAIENLGDETPQGSGLLCLAIVGGAVIPYASGAIADSHGIATALLLPAACYLWIAAYGYLANRGLRN